MLKSLAVLVSCIVVAVPCAYGQEDTTFHIGLGVMVKYPTVAFGIVQSPYYYSGFVTFVIPLHVTQRLRIEPEFGYYASSRTQNFQMLGDLTESWNAVYIGTSIDFLLAPLEGDPAFHLCVGPRIAVMPWQTTTDEGTPFESTDSETPWLIGVSTGCEYSLSSHFSLGGRVELNYLVVGEETISPSDYVSPRTRSGHILHFNTDLGIRWYFQ